MPTTIYTYGYPLPAAAWLAPALCLLTCWFAASRITSAPWQLESRGVKVTYFADIAANRPAGTKPRGQFDLRDVTTLRASADPSAAGSVTQPPGTVARDFTEPPEWWPRRAAAETR